MKPKEISWREYFILGSCKRLSMIGDRHNISWLSYNPFHFYIYHRFAIKDAPKVIKAIISIFPAALSYADIGSGSGTYAAEFKRNKKSISCCENSIWGRSAAFFQGVYSWPFDLNFIPPSALKGPFDIVYCFEVAEHISESLGYKLIDYLTSLGPIVIFSAAQPGQGGSGHIHEMPKSYWIDLFKAQGMDFNPQFTENLLTGFQREDVTATWFINNTMVFCKP